ncbi:MAG: prolyl oligopeptidase family serine peptidase [Planctomycetota bacterium]
MIRRTSIRKSLITLSAVFLLTNGYYGQQTAQCQEDMNYPEARTVDQVDEYFGELVADPYRWLEDDVRVSDEVKTWVDAQNDMTFDYLESLESRDAIRSRLTELWNYARYGVPFKTSGGRYFFQMNTGLQNQPVLYMMSNLDAEPEVLIDPNEWSEDGTTALSGMAFSADGKYLAYGVQKAGSDWRTWRVMEIDTRTVLEDEINWIKFGGGDWSADSRGFFYNRYDEPDSEDQFQALNKNQKVFYHRIGTTQAEDILIHADPDHPDWGFSPTVTDDGKYLVLTVWVGTDDRYRILYKRLGDDGQAVTDHRMVELIDNFDNEFTFIGNDGPVFYFKSDVEAAKKCILAIDVGNPARENWKTIIPESTDAMESASMVGDYFICDYLEDARTVVKIFDLDGNFVRNVEFPGIGSASGFSGKRSHTETFYTFSSFNRPPAIYHYDLVNGEATQFRQAEVDFDPEDYVVEQVFYESKDGTRVPMFIAYKKGIELNGNNPTLLYGYGGFNISLPPGFSVARLQWMEMGGVFAVANLRGGGEYGKDWHKAGTKTQKQNVFDDFIAAAEWLIENKFTSPQHLGIQGRSNGGLLVGACMTQRPELYGACLPGVGVMDMLRFQEFTAGKFWVDDYGSSTASAEEFQALRAYSPYHNIDDGVSYPPTLVVTADHDDRVVPGHSFKFMARLQAAQAGNHPALIRIEVDAGHGAGIPTDKKIAEVADEWTFLAENLGLDPWFPGSEDD